MQKGEGVGNDVLNLSTYVACNVVGTQQQWLVVQYLSTLIDTDTLSYAHTHTSSLQRTYLSGGSNGCLVDRVDARIKQCTCKSRRNDVFAKLHQWNNFLLHPTVSKPCVPGSKYVR